MSAHAKNGRMQPAPPSPRARDLGLPFDGRPGPANAITDVAGVEVGHVTLISGDGPLRRGEGPVRTGVTAVLPRGKKALEAPCAAGTAVLNGNGELTGRAWIDESGLLETPIITTSSHAVGACHSGVDSWLADHAPRLANRWMLPVVGETWDGYLHDINGGHVRPEHARRALDVASGGRVGEGNVGGGTGMNCYGFKGGIGTASRVVDVLGAPRTVGVLLQANFGARHELRLRGMDLGRGSAAPCPMAAEPWLDADDARVAAAPGAGSVIAIVATDAPLLPSQCAALARRVPLGLARTGTTGGHFSGDIFLAFSTADADGLRSSMGETRSMTTIAATPWGAIDPLYAAVVEATEEAVMNALVAARDMVGRDGHASFALPHDEIRAAVAAARPAG